MFLVGDCINTVIEVQRCSPHRVYGGLNFSGLTVDIPIAHVRYRGSGFTCGPDFGYEYKKPESLYFGAHFNTSIGNKGFKAVYRHRKEEHVPNDPLFGGFAIQVGYNILLCNDWLLTPYTALGDWFIDADDHGRGFHETLCYFAYGLKGMYGFNAGYAVGWDLQFFRTFHGRKKFKNDHGEIHGYFETPGAYLGLPLKIYFGSCWQWDFQCEPYLLAFSLGEKQLAYGARLNVGYNF
jgi:hypothetical protein